MRYDGNGIALTYTQVIAGNQEGSNTETGDSLHGAVDENWLLNDFIALRLKYWKHPDRQRLLNSIVR
jgi:hypothetical protein